jgi:hypothetical protein
VLGRSLHKALDGAAMQSHPEQIARNRYSQSFQSKIFQPLSAQEGPAFQPAGKRRDQTTSELFGNYDEKDLRPMPKTFTPKDDAFSAREKKQQFLASHVLQQAKHKADISMPSGQASEAGYVHPSRPAFDPYQEDEIVDANLRRQEELKSKLFGRETPAMISPQLHERTSRLTPNDLKWHNVPEKNVPSSGRELSHSERAYQEKCSGLFDHCSPQTQNDWNQSLRQSQEEEFQGDMKRRVNVYYSDLFGRSAQADKQDMNFAETRRPRTQSSSEDKIIVHQDWTNAKTELMHSRESRAEEPYQRKSEELHKARIFGEGREAWQPTERLDPVTYDNSDKLKEARGRGTQQIHQAHLRTSMTPNEFYEEAENSKHWEVAELHLSGLHANANDEYVRNLCQGFDLQLVKVAAEVDPVRNLCKGRAKVMVRYNPKRDSITGLVRKFESSRLKVEL